VFISKIPEWTSSLIYYSKPEYFRAKHASDHEVRGSFALIFDPDEMSCCAVLELVSVKEKPDFNSEMKMFAMHSSLASLYCILYCRSFCSLVSLDDKLCDLTSNLFSLKSLIRGNKRHKLFVLEREQNVVYK
jgi:hypothetical protein